MTRFRSQTTTPRSGVQSIAARAWRWWSARPALGAAVIYALLSAAFVGQGLLPGRTLSNADMLWSTTPWTVSKPADVRFGGANFELADVTAVFLPFFEHAKSAVPNAPLWNPYVMGGRPFLANAQSAIFSPFTAPIYAMSVWKAFAVSALLKLFVAAFGTYLLSRALGMRFAGALLAGAVYAFGTFFVAWLGWPLTNVFPLVPWLLLLTELVIRRPEPLRVAGLAALIGVTLLGGHPETSFHTLVATAVFFGLRLLTVPERGRAALAFFAACGLGAALAAAMLVPLAELFVHSADYTHRLDQAPGHANARFLGAFFLFDYWGRPTQTPLIADIVSNRGFYAGGITLMLAAAGLTLRPTRLRVGFALAAAFVLAIVVGADPIFSAVTALPGFSTAHNGRLVFLVLFCLALLAGFGLDELTSGERAPRARRLLTLGAAVAIFCVPFAWMLLSGALEPRRVGSALEVAWGFADPPSPPIGRPPGSDIVGVVRMSALLQWTVLAGAGLTLVALALRAPSDRRRALPLGALAALAVLVLVADLFRANMGFNPAIPIDHAEPPVTPALRYLQSQTPNRFAVMSRQGIDQPLQPDLAMRYGLYDARGYDYPIENRYDTFWRADVTAKGGFIEPTQRAGETERALRGLSLLSVTDLLHYPEGPGLRFRGLRLVYSGPDARVYRNTRAVPRAFLVGAQRTVATEDAALAAVGEPGFNPRRVAITETSVPGIPAAASGTPGSARLVEYGEERAVVKADARERSLLVLTDVHFPGWKATVDGKPADIERVDYLLRGVVIPAGVHRVEFRYEPASWRVGWIVSLIALIVLAATAMIGLRGRATA